MRGRLSRSVFRSLPTLTALMLLGSTTLHAQTPYGWINNGHNSAYTLMPGEVELGGNLLRVNDTLDIFDFQADLLATTTRLGGDSGYLDGNNVSIRAGILEGLDVFYRRQQQGLKLEINQSAQFNIEDLSNELDTTSTSYGLRWVLFESNTKNPQQAWRSAAIELSAMENTSKDFEGRIQFIELNSNFNVRFDPPQRFAMDRLKDDGWKAKLIVSTPLTTYTTASGWFSYADMTASSGTSSEIDVDFLRAAFLQTFDSREKQLAAGFNLNWQRFPRMPVQAGYEYIRLFDRTQDIVTSDSSFLPSFLRGSNRGQEINNNHSAYLNISYWVTPNAYIGLGGRLFLNQFTGFIPHYFNPLSGRFSDTAYGYAELKLGVRFNPLSLFRD